MIESIILSSQNSHSPDFVYITVDDMVEEPSTLLIVDTSTLVMWPQCDEDMKTHLLPYKVCPKASKKD